jgi:transcriptional regulator with XRE-family HTH domain
METSKRRGKVLRMLREAKGWSQQDLVDAAQAANGGRRVLTKAYLSKIEMGARNVGSEVLDAILLALEVADDALTSKRAVEIEGDPTGFIARETLAAFVVKDKLTDDGEVLQRMLAVLPHVEGPTSVDEWRQMYPYLLAYHRTRSDAHRKRAPRQT